MQNTFCPIAATVEEQMIRESFGGESINSARNALLQIMPESERIERAGDSGRISITDTNAHNYLDEKMRESNNEIDGRRYSRVEIEPPFEVESPVRDSGGNLVTDDQGNVVNEILSYPGVMKYITIDGKQPELTIEPWNTTLYNPGGSVRATALDVRVSSSLDGENLNSLLDRSSSLSNFQREILERRPENENESSLASISIEQRLSGLGTGENQFNLKFRLANGVATTSMLEGTFERYDSNCGSKFNDSRPSVSEYIGDRESGRTGVETGGGSAEAPVTNSSASGQ